MDTVDIIKSAESRSYTEFEAQSKTMLKDMISQHPAMVEIKSRIEDIKAGGKAPEVKE